MKSETKTLGFVTERILVRPIRSSYFLRCLATRQLSRLAPDEKSGSMLAVSFNDKHSFQDMIKFRNEMMRKDRGYFFGLFATSTETFLGEVMLDEVRRGARQDAIVGAIIHSAHRRQGYATEALSGLLGYGFNGLNLHRIEGEADPKNQASLLMCRKVGFRQEGLSIKRIKQRGRWRDKVLLSITRDEIQVP